MADGALFIASLEQTLNSVEIFKNRNRLALMLRLENQMAEISCFNQAIRSK